MPYPEVCGNYTKIRMDVDSMRPIYQKNDKSKMFLMPKYQYWTITNNFDFQYAFTPMFTNTQCPYDEVQSEIWDFILLDGVY